MGERVVGMGVVCFNANGDGLWTQVVRTDFSAQDWSKCDSHYTVVIEAVIDNCSHPDDLPLAPWS